MAGGSYRKLPRYAALAPLLQGRRVLDLGCGDGLGAAFLASGRATDVLALDADAGVARAAHRSLGRPGLSFQHGAPTELPVGIVTAFCGAPFFLYLLRRRRRAVM